MHDYFRKEIFYIKSPIIRRIVSDGVQNIPKYFFTIPASSSGKFHPQYALGNGGLYRHVQAVIIIANELFRMDRFKFSQTQKDLIIGSIILHDGWKQGATESGWTEFEHPTIAARELWKSVATYDLFDKYYLFQICLNIASHMGQWNKDEKTGRRLLPPITKMQKFVHLCDYIASRKQLELTF